MFGSVINTPTSLAFKGNTQSYQNKTNVELKDFLKYYKNT